MCLHVPKESCCYRLRMDDRFLMDTAGHALGRHHVGQHAETLRPVQTVQESNAGGRVRGLHPQLADEFDPPYASVVENLVRRRS